jgi:hypothetical protein
VFAVECSSFRCRGCGRSAPRRDLAEHRPGSPELAPSMSRTRRRRRTSGHISARRRRGRMGRRSGGDAPLAARERGAVTFGCADGDYRALGDGRDAVFVGPRGEFAAGGEPGASVPARPHERARRVRGVHRDGSRGRERHRRRSPRVRVPAAPHRATRRPRRRALVQRLEGDDAARRAHRDPRVRLARADRGRAGTRRSTSRPRVGAVADARSRRDR